MTREQEDKIIKQVQDILERRMAETKAEKETVETVDLGHGIKRSISVDSNKAYLTYEYPLEFISLLHSVEKVYLSNEGIIQIKDIQDIKNVERFARQYETFISADESIEIYKNVYNEIGEMQEKGIFKKNYWVQEIAEAFLAPAIMTDINIIAWRWYFCDSDWYTDNIEEYITEEYQNEFKRLVKFNQLFTDSYTTHACFRILKNIMRSSLETKEKHTYVFKDTTGLYMVGRTKETICRYKSIKSGNTTLENVMTLNGDFSNQIYKDYADKRVQGIWFKFTKEDLDKIKSLNK